MTRTTSPWAAWPVGSDPVELASRLRAAHEQFLAGASLSLGESGARPGKPGTVRRVVLDSWFRSRRSGIDPERPVPPMGLAPDELRAYRRTHVLAPLMPIVRRLLIDGTGSDGMVVALADVSGRLLWVDGDRKVRRDIEDVGFVEGARWAEQDAGTNAPGMALASDHEVQIFTAEHFARAVQPWSCTAAPVHDPTTGRMIGVLDITGRAPAASPLMLSLVRSAVAAMESELAVRALHLRLSAADADRGPRGRVTGRALSRSMPWSADQREPHRLEVLGTSSGGIVVDGERHALTLRHAELLLMLATHPDGLSGDELTVRLYGETSSAVTVRAEMSRLRRAVGPLIGESRPYRLAAAVRTTVDDVREHLAQGDVLAAVREYTGPVLPRSDAPGVVALREELAAEVRAALTRTHDVRALEAWTHGPAGADDWDAWNALLRLVPAGSPTWIRARAHVDVLDRSLGSTGPRRGAERPASHPRPGIRVLRP